MSDDLDLLEAWRGGDQLAGETLVRRHFDAVYRFFVNKTAANAEDLVQETFLACVEGRDAFRGAAPFRQYVFAIARRRLFRYWRDEGGADPMTQSISALADPGQSPAEAMVVHQEQKLLLAGLRRLPLDTQVLLELAYFEGMTDRELAALEGMPLGTLKSRLRKARAQLDEAMGALASAALLRSTTMNFDAWAKGIRGGLRPPASAR